VLSLLLKAIVDNVTGFAAIKTQIILETCLALFGSEIYAGNPPSVYALDSTKTLVAIPLPRLEDVKL
jgi:hypothetical protein